MFTGGTLVACKTLQKTLLDGLVLVRVLLPLPLKRLNTRIRILRVKIKTRLFDENVLLLKAVYSVVQRANQISAFLILNLAARQHRVVMFSAAVLATVSAVLTTEHTFVSFLLFHSDADAIDTSL